MKHLHLLVESDAVCIAMISQEGMSGVAFQDRCIFIWSELWKAVFDTLPVASINQTEENTDNNVIHYFERGDWAAAELLGQHLGITERELSSNYRNALLWAHDIIAMIYE